VPLLTGIAWIIISLIVFRFDAASVKAVGILVGVVFLFVGIEDLMTMTFVEGGWKWFYGIVGVLLVIGGIIAISRPVNTFVALAALVGWLLALKGIFDMVLALTNRGLDLCGFGWCSASPSSSWPSPSPGTGPRRRSSWSPSSPRRPW